MKFAQHRQLGLGLAMYANDIDDNSEVSNDRIPVAALKPNLPKQIPGN